MTLKEAGCGDRVIIKDFLEEEEILKKLLAMGLRKGSQFEVLKKCGRNILIRNGVNRLILSKELAEKILVDLIERRDEFCERELSCEFIDETCPKEEITNFSSFQGENSFKKDSHGNKPRERKKWSFFSKLCPLLSFKDK